MSSSSGRGRGDIAMVVTIVLGLLIGFFIKRVHIGLLIGIALGLMASVFLPRKK